MKTKQLVFGVITALLGIVASVFTFINIFELGGMLGDNATHTKEFFGFFSQPENIDITYQLSGKTWQPAFKTIAGILAIIVAVATVAYILLFALDTKKGNKFNGLRKLLSVILVVCGILIAICLIIFVVANSPKVTNNTSLNIWTNVFGAIALTVFPVLGGLCGALAEGSAKGKKKGKK